MDETNQTAGKTSFHRNIEMARSYSIYNRIVKEGMTKSTTSRCHSLLFLFSYHLQTENSLSDLQNLILNYRQKSSD